MSEAGWMDDLRFYVLFNNISVISGRCLYDNEASHLNRLYISVQVLGNYGCQSKGISYNGQVFNIAQHAKG